MQEYNVVVETKPGTFEEVLATDDMTLQQLAEECQKNYRDRIVLANVNGRLRELNKKVTDGAIVSFLNMTERDGKRTYRRSVTLLLQKAVDNLWGDSVHVRVFYSLGEGYYCELENDSIDDEKLAAIKSEMQRLVELNLPIEKNSVKTEEAEHRFRDRGMKDKERLLHYRRSSRVNLYSLDGMEDYFYGYMVSSTGYLGVFDLQLYEDGFVLLFPNKDGSKVEPLNTSNKLYHTLKQSREWSRMLGVGTIGALNDAIAAGKGEQIVLLQEALMEERIGALAAQIAERGNVKFVMIAGPSSSGKTSFSNRLSIQLLAKGLKPHPVGLDDYYLDRRLCPKDEDGNLDFECLGALDVEQFNKDMTRLLNGEAVEMPSFNFKTGQIAIKQQLQCKDGVYFLETPKSGKCRVLSPAPVVMEALKDEQQQQNANKQIVGAAWENKFNLVFTDALGKNLVRRTVVKHFKAVIERANIPPDVRFHDLRHSFAVTSLYTGDDIKTVQANLGHATAQFTLDVYGHVTQKMRQESAMRMQAFYNHVSAGRESPY